MGSWGAITLLLFIGAAGKSAQVPLYVWLPEAMEGPTPVSALIHAATMVTAGVYMIARSAPLYSRAPETLFIIAVVGISTALLAALIATAQRDIKKVLAYSTISQLGYMFVAMGVGAFGAGIFHLLTHAFFKALLFLGSGSVIMALHHEQDLFNMGGLRKYLPVTFYTMWMGTLAIAGVPLFSGFFSKDAILWKTFATGNEALWLMGVVVAGLTAFYMSRLMFLAFHGRERSKKQHQGAPDPSPREPSWSVTVPLVILAGFSLLAGYIGLPNYLGSNRLEGFLAPSFRFQYSGQPATAMEQAHLTEVILTLVTLAVAFFGFALAYHLYIKDPQVTERLANRFSWPYQLLRRKFFVDEIYDWLLVGPVQRLSRTILWKGMDVRVIDGLVHGTASLMQAWSHRVKRIQSGYTRLYATWILGGALLILFYYYWISP